MFKFPCKDCTKRYVGCHAKCEPYLKAKQIKENENNTVNKQKQNIYFNNRRYNK